MKKFANLVAVFAALVLALSCFVACSSGDDDNDSTEIVGNDNAGSNDSVSKSTWVSADGDTLTVDDDGTYEFVSSGKTYKGTYTVTASTGGNSTGTLKGDVVGNYTITDKTMAVVITSPTTIMKNLTKK